MKTLGIYVRVSTEEQIKGLSLDTQKVIGIQCSKTLGWEYKIYEDQGISGSKPIIERPGLNRLLEDIIAGKIHGVHVFEFSRITRDVKTFDILKLHFKENNTKFFINGSEEDLTDLNVELLSDIRSLLAQFEANQTRNRVKENLLTSAKKGRVGGGIQPYGYKRGEDKMLIIDEVEKEIVEEIYRLAILGEGTKAIATILNDRKIPTKFKRLNRTLTIRGKKITDFVWKDPTVYGILTNPIYKGERKFKNITVPSPIIIQPNVFDAVQEQLKTRNRFKNTTNKYFYLLKGLIICKGCNVRMSGYIKPSRGMRVYRCNSKRSHISHNCGSRAINLDFLNKHVVQDALFLPQRIKQSYDWYEKFVVNKKIDSAKKIEKDLKVNKKLLNETYLLDIPIKRKEEAITKLSNIVDDLELKQLELKAELKYFFLRDKLINDVKKMTSKLNINTIDKNTQLILRSLIKSIDIAYVDNNSTPYHTIVIEYKIDNNSNVILGTNMKINTLKHSVLERSLNVISIGDDTYSGESQPPLASLPLPISVNI